MDVMKEIERNINRVLSNDGTGNTGESNKGSLNSGSMNTGGMNSGDYNSGDYNTGENNAGDYNTGDYNSGNFNTGNFNKGNYNTGDFNLCNDSSGVFCTERQKIKIFDNDSDLTFDDWRNSDTYKILSRLRTSKWISAKNMSKAEKLMFPEYKITGGYLKEISYQDAFISLWRSLTTREKEIIILMPNFDRYKFLSITGIRV